MAAPVLKSGNGKHWKEVNGKPTEIFNPKTGKWDPIKHPRDSKGQFAETPGVSGISSVEDVKSKVDALQKGKQPPANWKFYKPGYKPKKPSQIPGTNSASDGKALWNRKKAGEFANDYEFWLAAQKLASAHKKKHPNGAATPNGIVNYAFHLEQEETGTVQLGIPHQPAPSTSHSQGKTSKGLNITSKYLAPGQLKPTGKKMPGVNGAMVYEDGKGAQWLVKFPGGSKGTSQAYSNSLFLVDLDVATSRIQSKAGIPVPSIHAKEVDGKIASVHKMYSRVEDAFPNNKVDLHALSDKEVVEVQQNMVLDWLISNHDPHSGNFLKTDKGIIGIDKGQSFKYFGKDKLTPNFGSDINPPLSPNVPVYSTLMKQHMQDKGGLLPFNEGELGTTIQRLMAIPDAEYKDLLRPYAQKADNAGLLKSPYATALGSNHTERVNLFLQAAVDRKNNLATDFGKLWDELSAKVPKVDAFGGPPAPKANKVKIPGELAKDFKAVAVGDYVKLSGDVNKVVGVGPSYITLDDGTMVGPTDFDMGNVEWASAPNNKIPHGYTVNLDPTLNAYVIKKPNGQVSNNKEGGVKTWPTAEDAANSSTMAKYKATSDQQAVAGMAGAQAFAASAPDIPLVQQLLENGPYPTMTTQGWKEYGALKKKIAAGEGYTPDEYLKLKTYVSTIKGGAKAGGAAQVEHGFDADLGGFEPPTPSQNAAKKGKLPTPHWKKKGGAPAALSAAKGPNALDDGAKLYEMKKAGQFNDDDELWKAASKLSNAYKKQAQTKDPNKKLVSGEDYASPNQIRNVSQRLEFDEVGDVIWETKAEKTAQTENQSAKQVKSANALHTHKPTVKASAAHHVASHAKEFANNAFDPSQPIGSYQNPHAFKNGDTQALQAYGYKYTDHSQTWPSDQKNAWYNFSGGGSGPVNTYFRVGEAGFSFGNIEETKKRCKALVDAFKSPNVKPLADWTQVVRGTAGGWEFGIGSDTVSFDELKAQEGKVVRNKEPKSSSLREQPPWGSIRITYKLPPGFRGLGIYGKSAHASENEMILPPGLAYRILEVKKGSGYSISTEVLVEVVDVKLPEIT